MPAAEPRPAGAGPVQALVCVHDLMPETLGRVERIVALCAESGSGPLTLLVVPGLGWDRAGIARLRAWQDQGHRLAGHGWVHRVERFKGLAHRLHGLAISRRVAEHLALDAQGIASLVRRCHDWFPAQGLAPPALYVPPAWAMGPIGPESLAALPFAQWEVLTGVRGPGGRLLRLPMVGYEGDTRARRVAIRLWNRANRARARACGWLRIAIHPGDLDLGLAAELRQDLARFPHRVDYSSLPL
jgi:predicted deacetylase